MSLDEDEEDEDEKKKDVTQDRFFWKKVSFSSYLAAMSTITTTFNVGMTCGGCANAVTKVLNKIEGVLSINTLVDDKKVIVTHESKATPEEMLKALKKWGDAAGKTVELL